MAAAPAFSSPRSAFFAVAIAAVLVTVACGKTADPTAAKARAFSVQPPAEDVFRYAAIGSEFFDPAKIGETAGHQLMLNVFEGLYTYALGDGPPVPSMATGCTATDAGLVYTCTLRDGVRWTDGKAITANDFVTSWRRVLNPATASRSAQLLWFIRGAKAYNDGREKDPNTVGVRAIDDKTLRIELASATPFFLHLLAEMPYAPTPQHVIAKHGTRWTRPDNIVSNGPYRLVKHVRRSLTVLEKNDAYWDADNVQVKRIEAYITESEQTAFDWYEVGKVDWTGDPTLPLDKLARLASSGRADVHRDPYLCTYYYAFATHKPPFSNPKLRRALSLAIDRQRLLLHVLDNGAKAASGNIPDLFGPTHNYRVPQRDHFDPERARKLLAEAGYPGGVGLPPIELTFNTQDVHRVVAEFVQRSLRENLGIKVVLANMEWKTLLKRMRAGEFALSRSGWCADYPDPLTFLEVFHSDAAANYARFDNSDYDKLIDTIRTTTDDELRNHLLFEAEQLLARQRPMLPIYHYARAYMLRPWIRGFRPQMQDFHPFKYLRINRGADRQPKRGS